MSEGETRKGGGLFGRLFGRKEAEPAKPEPQKPVPQADPAEAALGDSAPAHSPDPVSPAVDAEQPTSALPAAEPTPTEPVAPAPAPVPAKQGWLSRLTSGLAKTSAKLADGITGIFTKRKLDGETLEDLEDLLIGADLGVETSSRIIETIRKGRFEKGISPDDVRRILADEVERVLVPVAKPLVVNPAHTPHVVLVVGVNGSGKTTTIGKLAAQLKREGKSVMLAAGDTFRAAAIDQLEVWGQRTGSPVLSRPVGSDSSGLAYDALKQAIEAKCDVLIVDTAGRLQNKSVLMDELEKVVRVLRKLDPSAPHDCVLVLDATTGQNALGQVEVFRQRAGVTGLVMTKLDGTAKGGILVAIAARYGLPVHAIGVGEGIDDLAAFDPHQFAETIARV